MRLFQLTVSFPAPGLTHERACHMRIFHIFLYYSTFPVCRCSTFSLKVLATPSQLSLLKEGNLGRSYNNKLLFLTYLVRPYIPFYNLIILQTFLLKLITFSIYSVLSLSLIATFLAPFIIVFLLYQNTFILLIIFFIVSQYFKFQKVLPLPLGFTQGTISSTIPFKPY